MSFTVNRYHDISCGHRVYGHESKCAHLHGHNYRIHFTCRAGIEVFNLPNAQVIQKQQELDTVGRVIDFSEIKKRLCMWIEKNWDHKFLMWEKDPDLEPMLIIDANGVVAVPFNPTAENMAEYLVTIIGPIVLEGTGIYLAACTVEETAKCSAFYVRP